MKRVLAPTPWSQERTALAVNSGPLSEAEVLRYATLDHEVPQAFNDVG